MCLETSLNGCSGYISVWKIYFVKPVLCKIYLKSGGYHHLDSNYVLRLLPNLFFNCNLKCVCILTLCHTIMMEERIRKPVIVSLSINGETATKSHMKNSLGGDGGGRKTDKAYFSTKLMHSRVEETKSNVTTTFKSAKLLSQNGDGSCQDKTDSGPSLWKRRDSFSSCSSDSAVYCSSMHAQADSCAQEVTQNHRIAEINGKKRHRNSSGSSALSSASDSSNKDMSNVANILNCFQQNSSCTEQSLSELNDNSIGTRSGVKPRPSVSHFPVAVTSESKITTFVEQSLSYTCQSAPTNERFHNLRRQIRKKTCHNCDCNGAHTTVLVRRYTQIKQATNHVLPKVKSLHRVLPQHGNHLTRDLVKSDDSSEITPSSLQKDHSNRRRRTEVDKLYDALHEIQWAKHISPDNILNQIDFRRAATLSVYSSKERDATLPKFKSPQCPKSVHHFTRNSKRKFTAVTCSDSMGCSDSPESSGSFHCSTNRDENSLKDKTVNKELDVPVIRHVGNLKNGCDLSKHESVIENQEPETSSSETKNMHEDNQDSSFPCVDNSQLAIVPSGGIAPNIITKDAALEGSETKTVQDHQILSTAEGTYALIDTNGDIFALLLDSEDCEMWNVMPNSNSTLSEVNPSMLGSEVEIINEEVIFEGMYPDIVDVETSDACTLEKTRAHDALISPSLPVLTRVEPPAEHPSSDSPPHLEPAVSSGSSRNAAKTKSANRLRSPPALNRQSTSKDSTPANSKHRDRTHRATKKKRTSILESEIRNIPEVTESQGAITPSLRNGTKNCRTGSKQNSVKNSLFRKYFNSKQKCKVKYNLRHSTQKQVEKNEITSKKVSKVETVTSTSVLHEHHFPLAVETLEQGKQGGTFKGLRVHVHDCNHISFEKGCVDRINSVKGDFTECCELNPYLDETDRDLRQLCTDAKENFSTTGKNIDTPGFCENERKDKPAKKRKPLPLEWTKDVDFMPSNFTVTKQSIIVNKNEGYTQVVLKLTQGHNTYLSVNLLHELREALNGASADSECKVLVMNSIGKSFCMGLDLKPLIGPEKNSASKEIAVAVKNFVEALASFNKPLVVVVNGAAVGLGVTLLTYSDVIISSESASFHMPYSQLGFCPEGGATLMLPHVVGSTVAMDMLLRGRKLSAYEACSHGLISEVLTAGRLPTRLVERVRQLSESSSSAMESTKSMLRSHLYQRLNTALEGETALLPKQWLSETCQSILQKLLADKLTSI